MNTIINIPVSGAAKWYTLKMSLILALIMLFSLILSSCRQSQPGQPQTKTDAKLEVLYFHTAMRCPACLAIENSTKKVLNEKYNLQLANGIIRFSSIDFDAKENSDIVEKYQVSYLTLLIIKADGTKTDLTNQALQYAEANPEKFMELLAAEVDNNLR